MYRIAVLGDRDSIYGFAAVGLETFPVESAEEAAAALKKLAAGDYAIVYITEQYAALLERELAYYRRAPLPAVIPIPGVAGNNGLGIADVRHFVEQAVGSDIIFGNA